MENNKLFEPRTLVAVGVVFLGLISWNYFVSLKYPQPVTNVVAPVENQSTNAGTPSNQESQNTVSTSVSNATAGDLKTSTSKATQTEQFINIETDHYSVRVSSFGMGLKEVYLKNYKNKQNEVVRLGNDQSTGIFSLIRSEDKTPFNFSLQKVSDYEVIGTYVDEANNFSIQRILKFNQATYGLESKINFSGNLANRVVDIIIPDQILKDQNNHFLFPSYDLQDFFIKYADKTENINYSMSKTDIKDTKTLGHLLSMGSQYFSTAILNTADILPDFELNATVNTHSAAALIKYSLPQSKSEMSLSQISYFGPKKVEFLETVHPELVSVMNYGFFGFLAHPMLKLMKFFQDFVGNWGLAIILLTLVVRAIVLPFNLMSFKSMKAMQKIQPMMQSLKERYKDDPMALNRETMALMRENKANPLSGCLPMLLQIPIFFALYRVIASSIEIYQQPFVGWITDLSVYDKFFILPLLMGLTMYVQQKITPTTTVDPVQAKILLWMPILFTGLMVFLPSGLTLYMFISSLFGVIQQYFFMKMKTA